MQHTNEKKSCETCRHDTPGYVSIIGTHDHCCEKHYHCRPGSVALDYSPKDAKVCGTCNWHEDFSGACCNGNSEYRGDFTSEDDSCECWEGRDDGKVH